MDQTPRVPPSPLGLYAQDTISDADRRAVEKIERVRNRASAAASRLLNARPADAHMPTNALEFMDMVDMLAAYPRKYGVLLTESDRRAIKLYHGLIRAVIAGEQKREAKRLESERQKRLGITPVESA